MTMKLTKDTSVAILWMALLAAYSLGQGPKPAVVSAVAPVFPVVVMPLKLEGAYKVDVEIDRTGKVVSSKAIEGTHKFIRPVIEAAANRWQFRADQRAPS